MRLHTSIHRRMGFIAAALAMGIGISIAAPEPSYADLPPLPLPDLICQAGTQAEFGVVDNAVTGIYIGAYRNCTSPNGKYPQYVSWVITVNPINVNGCPQTRFFGSGTTTWVNRDTMTTEPGTVDFDVDLSSLATIKIALKVTSGPLTGNTISALVVPSSTDLLLPCPNGGFGIRRLNFDGQGVFRS
ncbi:hypothetical protein NDR87_00055 [Nocardia sp. CDC159]|uniref:Uncharacterized protein n=1 Tax=Nocardia pulmonis TaxID=2951408 RepID=A0A9X2IUX1_9NOCA|nr:MULTISPECIES: hypothetical protein [Nocardia]MCM6772598.1 hypothetical protein [Nocardia pulmonis]MCM6784744.1 hypothetical protein [Nocardia sp. CDC159]